MVIFKDETGDVYDWVMQNLKTGERMINTLTLGISNNNLCAGVVYSMERDNCYMTIYASSPKWCSRETLTLLFNIPFIELGAKIIRFMTSARNDRINKFLRGIGAKEEGRLRLARADGSDAMAFSIIYDELKRQRWYK
jgi:hypothetical protein